MKNSISTVDQKPDDLGPQWVKRIPVAKWGTEVQSNYSANGKN